MLLAAVALSWRYPNGIDWFVLTLGVIRTVAWGVGVYYAYRVKSTAALAGFAMATVSSLFFAFYNAGAVINDGLLATVAVGGTPIAVLMTVAISRRPRIRDDWEL